MSLPRVCGWLLCAFALWAMGGCDDKTEGKDVGGSDSGGTNHDTDSGTHSTVDTATGSNGGTGTEQGDSDTHSLPAVCSAPIGLVDTSNPTAVIGTGTAASCDESQLRSAAQSGGVITFNCGAEPVTIFLTQTIELPIDRDTVIDGGGLVTLDAGKNTRHFHFEHPDWMNGTAVIHLQRLTFVNGKAPTGEYFPQDPENPNCAYGYKEGSGGVIYVRNGRLRVVECAFYDNEAALEGPDVGGGAIYALGAPEVTIVGSRFLRNTAANGGAIGMLFANPGIYNSVFEDNRAVGRGMNYVEPGCPMFGHEGQGGAGGLSGAVYFDGMNDDGVTYTICGCVFRNNRCNELGGALFRTPNVSQREMLIDLCLFEDNTARMGGVSFIKQNHVTVTRSTFTGNRGGVDVDGNEVGGPNGGLWINEGTATIENCTFHDNQPDGLSVDGGGTVRNVTFSSSGLGDGFTVTNSVFVGMSCDSQQSGSNNVQSPGGSPCASGTTMANPRLEDLADNGGSTPTMMPEPESPVIGAGHDCPVADQRGQPRDTGTCAAGAVEP